MKIMVQSQNPFLLARMAVDLQMDGMIADVGFGWEDPWDSLNVDGTPTKDEDRRQTDLCVKINEFDEFTFYPQAIIEGDIYMQLTGKNYNKTYLAILKQIRPSALNKDI